MTVSAIQHQIQDLIELFHSCFFEEYNTQLVLGDEEPIYLPADENHPHHRLIFAHGFFASALHESAHWLVAGAKRREQVDFGYWYEPDGRNAEQQSLFQSAEVKPQAMEWILSQAAGFRFRVSLDNLDGDPADTETFKQAVYNQVRHYCEKGLSERAERFRLALADFYKTPTILSVDNFDLVDI